VQLQRSPPKEQGTPNLISDFVIHSFEYFSEALIFDFIYPDAKFNLN